MPNVFERLKQARQIQAGLVDGLRRELRPLGFDIVPIGNGGAAAPAGQYPCRIKGCSHPPLKTEAARLSHERGHKASRKAGRYPCRTKGCPHPPFKTQAARLSHERSRHQAKAPLKEAAKKAE